MHSEKAKVCKVNVNGERYCKMISSFFAQMLELDMHDMLFQHNGATSCTAHATMHLLRGESGEHFVSYSVS